MNFSKCICFIIFVIVSCYFCQLKVVGPVAVLGGLFQIALFMFLCGLTAAVFITSSFLIAFLQCMV
jgi:hypothetical protein